MELSTGKGPQFVVQRSIIVDGMEHQMAVALNLQGWHNGPITLDESAVLDLFRAARTFMELHTANLATEGDPAFFIRQTWQEELPGIETSLGA